MMASVVVGGNRKKSLTLRGVDPETCMIVFKNHWAQVVKILEKHEPGRGGTGALSFLSGHGSSSSSGALRLGPIPADEASAVQNYVEHMLFLLMEEEAGQGGAMGPILEFVVLEGVMERLFLWSLRRQFTEDMKLEQLRMYQMLLSQARQPLLHHKPVLRPLMMLLASCAGAGTDSGSVVEAELVLLLNQLCVALVKDPSVLELFFHTSEDQGAANFLLFSLLIPYTHRQGSVGQQARDALLLIMSLSGSDPRVAQHIAENTYFCPVLATGLSGLYSSLPARLQVYSEDWHCLDQADWQQVTMPTTQPVPALVHFLHSLDFCSAVTKVGYCRGSDFLMDVNYLHYLWDARQAISTSHRACQLWSAPYDGINPLPQEYRSDTPGDDIEDEEEIVQRAKSDSICSLVVTPPPLTLSPTLSYSDTVSTGNQAGRANSALELEWDDIFADDDLSLSGVLSTTFANGSMTMDVDRCTSTPAPPLPPRHIQEMRRTATKLVHGSYVEESEFQDDVLVYNLVAQTDTKAAILERIMAANRRARGSISNGQRVSTTATTTTIATMLTTTGRTVMETVNSIMSTRRRSEDAGKEERRWSDDYGKKVRRRSEDCGKEMWRRKEEAEDEIRRMCAQGEPKGRQFFTNGFNAKHHIIDECDDTDEDSKPFKQNCNQGDLITTVKHKHTLHQQQIHHNTQHPMPQSVTNALPNGHSESEPRDPLVSATAAKSPNLPGNNVTNKDDFLSRYHKLMLSLGVEPDCDDITDDISTFRKRVRELRQKLEEEEEGLDEEFVFSSLWDDREEEGEEEVMEEEEEEEEGEERRSGSKKGGKRHGVPFTGPFISVLLSRLENLLENSIAVNLLVTGILAQLASYPQPLLRSFLLSTDTHNLPNVRTLYQVLVTVNAQIERYVAARPEYPALVTEAWRFLLAKDQDSKFRECLQPQGGDIILDPSLPNGSVRNALPLPPLSVLPPCPPIPPQAKSRVFAIILYAEFLKELAAIAQEHSIALDCSSEE
ncbi:protein FAM160A1-like [Morone saxatilis]|uniref:protein FAM160A1-like n=1 Tax=Morone saxatilis TaxID=34816 RepID=UPI0015E1CD04|nr:protein FAM160A1-like [Morone saxatilis]